MAVTGSTSRRCPGARSCCSRRREIQESEGASGVLMNAIPMLGSLGSIVLVATMGGGGQQDGRSFLAAGMFLFATLGFIIVQIDRQRKQRAQQVTGSRTEYLRYLANIRKVARDAADAAAPGPQLAPPRARRAARAGRGAHPPVGARPGRPATSCTCATASAPSRCRTELVPPESAPVDQVDPAAASALHRLLVVHRVQPNLPASIDLRAFDRVEVCGPRTRPAPRPGR